MLECAVEATVSKSNKYMKTDSRVAMYNISLLYVGCHC